MTINIYFNVLLERTVAMTNEVLEPIKFVVAYRNCIVYIGLYLTHNAAYIAGEILKHSMSIAWRYCCTIS